jgi:hypothetical protein
VLEKCQACGQVFSTTTRDLTYPGPDQCPVCRRPVTVSDAPLDDSRLQPALQASKSLGVSQTEHQRVLCQVGWVLVLLGLLDVAYMMYCIVNRISNYVSLSGLFSIVAGMFLLNASLRAASIVRWLVVLALAGFVPGVAFLPFVQPLDLTLTHLRLNPGRFAGGALLLVAWLALFLWIALRLGHPAVLTARQVAGKKRRNMRIPAVLGVLLAVAGCAAFVAVQRGERVARAKSLASEQLGEGYRYHIRSLSVVRSARETSVTATVTAWNHNEIRAVPVHWTER